MLRSRKNVRRSSKTIFVIPIQKIAKSPIFVFDPEYRRTPFSLFEPEYFKKISSSTFGAKIWAKIDVGAGRGNIEVSRSAQKAVLLTRKASRAPLLRDSPKKLSEKTLTCEFPFQQALSDLKPGHTTGGSGLGGARRSGGAVRGRMGRRRVGSPRRQPSLVPSGSS